MRPALIALSLSLVTGCSLSTERDEPIVLTFDTQVEEETPDYAISDLCSHAIDDCDLLDRPKDEDHQADIDEDLATCEAWYDNEANCLDMEAYVECNGSCMEQTECDDYFFADTGPAPWTNACGESCFQDHCEV